MVLYLQDLRFALRIGEIVFVFCVSTDATVEEKGLGRLVNHSIHANAKMEVIAVQGKPHLCLFAVCDIKPGDQIVYDYGEKHLPFDDMVGILYIF